MRFGRKKVGKKPLKNIEKNNCPPALKRIFFPPFPPSILCQILTLRTPCFSQFFPNFNFNLLLYICNKSTGF